MTNARDEIARVIAKAEESTRTGSKPQRHRIVADAVIAHLLTDEVIERAAEAVMSQRWGADKADSSTDLARAALQAALGVEHG